MPIDRREFLKLGGFTALAGGLPSIGYATGKQFLAPKAPPQAQADLALTIGTGLVEVAPGRIISTTTYNGQFPGPLLRFKAGQKVIVDIRNDTDTPNNCIGTASLFPMMSTARRRSARRSFLPTACAVRFSCLGHRVCASTIRICAPAAI